MLGDEVLAGGVSARMSTGKAERNLSLSRIGRIPIWLLAIGIVIWAYLDPRFRDAEGFLEGTVCLPVAIGVALMVVGWTMAGRLKSCGVWFALGLIGQAVALQLIEAGPSIRYQHYKSFKHLFTDTHPFLIALFGLHTFLVAAGLRTRWSRILTWIRSTFKCWQVWAVGSIFFLSSATVSRAIPLYMGELFLATFIQAVNLGNVVLIVWALPDEVLGSLKEKFEKVFGQTGGEHKGKPAGVDRFTVVAAIWVVVVASSLNILAYERHPHLADEVVYLYHARYLAQGMLTLPAPPAPDAFNMDLMYYEQARWFSPVPPGWPAMLALGVLFGMPWLVNPVLAGVNVLLASAFLYEIYDRRTARMAVLLFCFSPWYLFMGMNFMPHIFTLTCALIAALGMVRAKRTGSAKWAWVSGMASGMVSLIRPLNGVVVAGLLGLWAVAVRGERLKASSIAAFVSGCVMVGSAVFPYNNVLTGDPLRFPIMAYTDKYYGPGSNALGFGPERGLGWPIDPFPGHAPLDALINANLNTFSVNIELFGWSIGSLVLIALMVFSRTMRRNDYLMLTTIAAVLGAYSLYWFSGGPDFGARYWFLMLVPLVALAVRGIQFLERMLVRSDSGIPHGDTRVIFAVLSLCLFALINYLPWRAIDKYHHYLGMRADIRSLAKQYNFGKSVVLIRGNRHPDYASAAAYNPVNLRNDGPVYAWDRNPDIQVKILNAYSDRPVWILNGPSITQNGFKVVGGPLSAHGLLAKDNQLQ